MEKLKKQIQEYQEAIEKNVNDLQTDFGKKFEDLTADQKASHENLVKDLEKNIKKIEEFSGKLSELEKANKDLELLLARRPEQNREGKDLFVGDPELRTAFKKAVKLGRDEVPKMNTSDYEKTMLELVEKFIPHFTPEERVAHVKAMMVGSDPDGGYLCPVDVSTRIVERMFETSPMYDICSVVTTLREAYKIPYDDGDIDAGWVGEIEERTETGTPQVSEIEIPTHEIYAYPKLTLKVVEDASLPLEAWIAKKVGSKFGRVANKSFLLGDGVVRPKGVLDYDEWSGASYERGKLRHLETAGATIAPEDLLDLQSELMEDFISGANWIMARKIFVDICKLRESSDGAFLINPKLLFEGYKPQILGSPVKFMNDMPKTQVTGAKAIGYGDFKEGYQIVNRLGIQMIRDNLTKKGWLKLFFRMRVGGAVANFDAIKILKIR